MQKTDFGREIRGFSLFSLRFAADSGRETKAVQRMNGFYEALETAAGEYAKRCLENCPQSWYICRITGEKNEDGWVVTTELTHKLPGVPSARKRCLHIWRNGLFVQEKIV